MKETEAPKKVYLHLTTVSHLLNGKYYEYKPAKFRYDDKIIEYARTDAFIESAVDYLSYHLDTSKIDVSYKFDFIEEFKKAMKI